MRYPTSRCSIVRHALRSPRYLADVTDRSPIDDILHRVNNLLGTIEIQSEVARTIGTTEALTEAIDHIVESARRTRADLDEFCGKGRDSDQS